MRLNEWKAVKLGDICTKIGSGATPTGGASAYKTEGTSLIRSQNILDFSFSNNGLAFIDDEQAKKLNGVTVECGDILLNITGDSVARTCIVPNDVLPARVNQHVSIIRVDKNKASNKFVLYYLQSIKPYLLSMASNGGTRNALTKNMIEQLAINSPTLVEQRSIADTLSCIDNKIELNNRINKTLEEIAQAIFKQWFVDFDFPDENGQPYKSSGGEMEESELGLIPKGWKVYKLGELVDSVSITHKFGSDKIIFLNTSDISEGRVLHHKFSLVEGLPGQAKKSIEKFDILFSEIRPANKRFAFIDFDSENYVVSTKLMVLRKKSHIHPIVIYSFLTSQETLGILQQLAESRSGTFPQITFNQVKDLRVAFPVSDLLDTYTQYAWSVFKMVSNLNKQTQALEQLRDSLLPKLMSGEIRVPVEEVPQSV